MHISVLNLYNMWIYYARRAIEEFSNLSDYVYVFKPQIQLTIRIFVHFKSISKTEEKNNEITLDPPKRSE